MNTDFKKEPETGDRHLQRKYLYSEEFPPPSIVMAESRRDQIVEAIEEIQLQLGDRTRRTRIDLGTGKQITSDDYQAWRARARKAMLFMKRELRFLKSWIASKSHELIAQEAGLNIDFDDPNSLISESYQLLIKLKKEGFRFDTREWTVVCALKNYLEGQKTS